MSNIRLTIMMIRERLRQEQMSITKTEHGEYRVNFVHGKEESAYYTPDLKDALDTGIDMAKRRDSRKNPGRGLNLSDRRFFKGDAHSMAGGKVRNYHYYGYETGNAIYDVRVIDGVREFRKNSGPWTHTPEAIHLAIIRHFNLPGTMSNPRRRTRRNTPAFPTVRLVNKHGERDGEWYVDPGDSKLLARIHTELSKARAEEPGMDWHLETRGTHAGWHRWRENPRRTRRNSRKRGLTRKLARAVMVARRSSRVHGLRKKLRKRLGFKFRKDSRYRPGFVRHAALLPKRRNPTIYRLDDGAKAVARSVQTLSGGRQVELFAVRKYGKLYWTADFGVNYAPSKNEAIQTASRLNLVRK